MQQHLAAWAHDCARKASGLVRGGGLEPPQYCYRQDLNLVRLPISPPARLKKQREFEHFELPPEIGQLEILACIDPHFAGQASVKPLPAAHSRPA